MTATWAPTRPEVTVEASSPTFGIPAGLGVPGAGWQAFVVDQYGAMVSALPVTSWGALVERRGEASTMSLGIPWAHVDDAPIITSEVQVYRDEKLMFWGVPVQRQWGAADSMVSVALVDLSWWLTRRLCTQDALEDLVRNGGFEVGLTRWSKNNATVDATVFDTGTQSAKLTSLSSHITQQTTVDRAGTYAVSARVRVDNATFVGVGPESGLEVGAMAYTGVGGGRDVYAYGYVTGSTPRDQWVTLAGTVTLATDGPWTLFWKIHGIDGDLNVDNVHVRPYRIPRRTEAAGIFAPEDIPQTDTGRLARQLVTGALVDLNFSVMGSDSGIEIDDEVGAWDGVYAWEALDVLRRIEFPIDWSLLITPTTRTIRIWTPATARNGLHAITLDPDKVSSSSGTDDGATARTVAWVIGDGGFSVSVDAGGWDGLRIDEVVRAPTGTPVAELDGVGRSHLGASLGRVQSLSVTTHEGAVEMIDTIQVSDRLLVDATVAGLADAGAWDVSARSIDPASDRMTLTMGLAT